MKTLANERGTFNDDDFGSIPYGLPPGEEANGASTAVDDAALVPDDVGSDEPQEDEYVPSPSEQMALDNAVTDALAKLKRHPRITAVQTTYSRGYMAYSDGNSAKPRDNWTFVAILQSPCDSVVGSGATIDAAVANTLRKADAKDPSDPRVIDLVPVFEASIADVAARKAAAL